MKEQFEYGELVEVRQSDDGKWIERTYVGTMPNCNVHYAMKYGQNEKNFDGLPFQWQQVRKIQKDKIKSLETSLTRKEESRLRGDANWAISQAVSIGHREHGEIVRAAKILIDAQSDLIKHMKETWTD